MCDILGQAPYNLCPKLLQTLLYCWFGCELRIIADNLHFHRPILTGLSQHCHNSLVHKVPYLRLLGSNWSTHFEPQVCVTEDSRWTHPGDDSIQHVQRHHFIFALSSIVGLRCIILAASACVYRRSASNFHAKPAMIM